jgi:hypothetical protein
MNPKHDDLSEVVTVNLTAAQGTYRITLKFFSNVTNVAYWEMIGDKKEEINDFNLTVGIDEQIARLILKHRT